VEKRTPLIVRECKKVRSALPRPLSCPLTAPKSSSSPPLSLFAHSVAPHQDDGRLHARRLREEDRCVWLHRRQVCVCLDGQSPHSFDEDDAFSVFGNGNDGAREGNGGGSGGGDDDDDIPRLPCARVRTQASAEGGSSFSSPSPSSSSSSFVAARARKN